MKKVVIGVIVTLVVCLVLVVLAPFMVNLDRYKGTILAQVEPYLGRDVDFTHIELTILSGLGAEIQGLRVADNPRFSSADFISLDSLQVQVELLPLLKKEIKVRKIVLKRPVISVARNAGGEFSFDDILASLKRRSHGQDSLKKEEKAAGTPAIRFRRTSVAWAAAGNSDAESSSSSAALPLSIQELQIVKGKVLYRDEILLPDAGTLVIDALNLTMKDVSLDQPVFVDLSADLLESGARNVSIKGTLGPLGTPIDVQNMPLAVDLSVTSFPLAKISAFLPVKVLSGAVTVEVKGTGSPGNLSLNMRAGSDRIKFQLPPKKNGKESLKSGVLKGIKLDVMGTRTRKQKLRGRGTLAIENGTFASVPFSAATSDFSYRPGRVTIDSLSIQAFDGSIQGEGLYDIEKKAWLFDPSMQGVDVSILLNTLTEQGGIFAGTLSGNLHAEGTVPAGKKPKIGIRGSVLLAKGEWKNFNLVESVLDNLFGIEGVGRFLSYQGGEVARHESTRFDSLDGTFEMKDTIIQVQSLTLRNIQTSKATNSVAILKGIVDRTSKTLDLRGVVILSERHSRKLAEKADILRALLNNQRRMVLPITLKGSIRKPIPFLDTEYVLNALSSYYIQKGTQKLLEKLF
ncbi:MAG: AsmA family protein [Thermodesulfobacteriota bacterium]|nr:AsmA family protein [Thermodesulfobacteriota bacterium]